jgi:hypothetical protein
MRAGVHAEGGIMLNTFGNNFKFSLDPILKRAEKVSKNFRRAVLIYSLTAFLPVAVIGLICVGIMKLAKSPYLETSFKDGKFEAVHEV